MVDGKTIKYVANECGCGLRVAHELLILAGGDADLVINESQHNRGLDQCKIGIIDKRFKKIEDKESVMK